MKNRMPVQWGSVRSRSFSRVPDVSSVILRDSIIWLAFEDLLSSTGRETSLLPYKLERIRSSFTTPSTVLEDDLVTRQIIESGWGELALIFDKQES
jgi:hypothetical protein